MKTIFCLNFSVRNKKNFFFFLGKKEDWNTSATAQHSMNWNDCQRAYGEEEAREDLQGEELEKGITVFYGLSDHQKRCQVFAGNPVSMTFGKDKNSQSCL